MTLSVNYDRFNAQLDAIKDAMTGAGMDASHVLERETVRLSRLIVNMVSPPERMGGQLAGEEAIRKDLYSLISEADSTTLAPIVDKYGTKDVNTAISTKTGDIVNLQWENIAIGSGELSALHQDYRDKRGRVPHRKESQPGFWKSRVIVVRGLRDEYIAAVQQRVGRMKAKWAYCAAQLGQKFPPYVTRHLSAVANSSMSRIQLTSKNPSVTFGGMGEGFGRTVEARDKALGIRAGQMENNLKAIMSGYNKDVLAGIRVRPHAGDMQDQERE